MIALTQEKREELIACANEIKKMATSTHGYKVGNDAFGSNALILMEIALASLTAEPAYYVFKHPNGKLFHSSVDESCKGHNDVYPVFTTPPVPEIKLPSNLQDAFEDGNKIPPNTQRCGDSYCVSTFHNWKGEEFMHQYVGFLKGVNYVKGLNGWGE